MEKYDIGIESAERIISRFGHDFYERLGKDLDYYSREWKLSDFSLVDSLSVNCVFFCKSEKHGSCVLKIGPYITESLTECAALKEYGGRPFCLLYEEDAEKGVILVERIFPGETLWAEKDTERRLSVFCGLFKNLHIKPAKPPLYPTYGGWVRRISRYMEKREDLPSLSFAMAKAAALYDEISQSYTSMLLLHGDFHHGNILAEGRHHVIIDPKGVVGDPVFDLSSFALNEARAFEGSQGEKEKHLEHIFLYLEKQLDYGEDILRKCFFIQSAMSCCWSVQDGAKPEQCASLLNDVEFSAEIAGVRLG